ncbi:XkdX family protein [Niallia sp. RD1]|nr:XkdX family protein [Niallia sp. RD1]UTI44443.1 XkdX family protein [Niallia sp. RD1]
MIDWLEKISRFYKNDNWTKEQVAAAVELKKITKEQYKEITGDEYASE